MFLVTATGVGSPEGPNALRIHEVTFGLYHATIRHTMENWLLNLQSVRNPPSAREELDYNRWASRSVSQRWNAQ